jgi:MerR family transcriptional regulator, light-induced transcriptional regulator
MSALPSACLHLPSPATASEATLAPLPSPADAELLERFCTAVLAGDAERAQHVCATWTGPGAGRAADAYFGLVLPAIRRLDRLWHDDAIDFERVSMAFYTLQRVLRAALVRPTPAAPTRGLVCLALLPGAEHDFGICVVADAFQRAGWEVRLFGGDEGAELLRTLERHDVALLGLSLGNDRELEPAAALVAQARRRSRRQSMRVVIGGNILAEPRAQYAFIQADGVAFSAAEALAYAEAVSGIPSSGPQEAP